MKLGPIKISRVSCEEAREAATLLGADYLHFEVQYLSICYDNDSHRCVTAVVRKIPPDMVFTTTPKGMEKTADFMFRVGTVKSKPASWKDMFFPYIHDKPGS